MQFCGILCGSTGLTHTVTHTPKCPERDRECQTRRRNFLSGCFSALHDFRIFFDWIALGPWCVLHFLFFVFRKFSATENHPPGLHPAGDRIERLKLFFAPRFSVHGGKTQNPPSGGTQPGKPNWEPLHRLGISTQSRQSLLQSRSTAATLSLRRQR